MYDIRKQDEALYKIMCALNRGAQIDSTEPVGEEINTILVESGMPDTTRKLLLLGSTWLNDWVDIITERFGVHVYTSNTIEWTINKRFKYEPFSSAYYARLDKALRAGFKALHGEEPSGS